jgi:hypothetical protein
LSGGNDSSNSHGPLGYATPSPRRALSFLRSEGFRKAIGRVKTGAKWFGRGLAALLIVFALAMGFGTSAADAEKMRVFADAVERWQHNPDFRKVQVEYVELGSESMRTKMGFCDATRVVIWLRSLPGLPDHLKVNDTSLTHYTNFRRGPLSAYMHLTTEQGLGETLKMLKYLGSKASRNELTDDDVRNFLHEYKLHNPVVADAGAIASVRSLIDDVDPGRGFGVETDVAARIGSHAAGIARQLGYPTDLKAMSPEAQAEVWQMLDGEIRETDYELWRTKQVNDWLNGVWGQVYGTMYSGVIGPVLTLREMGRVGGPVMLMGWVGLGLWRRRREEDEAAVTPRLALEGPKDGDA